MSNQQIAKYTPEVLEAFKPEVLQVIRTSLCPTATDAEFTLFAHKAAAYRLDPFKNEIFFIKYGNQARIQFAAEAYLAKAREKDGFQPPDTQMVCENDTFKIRKNTETKELEVAEHEIGFPRGKIIGAYSIAYRDGHRPVTVIMDRSEIDHMFTGQNKENWNKWTTDMFGKHVEQRALKKQYGLDFGDDEIPHNPADNIPAYQERKDITHEASHSEPKTEPAPTQPAPSQPAAEGETEQSKFLKAKADMAAKFRTLGITRDKMEDWFTTNNITWKNPEKGPTLGELVSVNRLLDMQISQKENDPDLDPLE